MALTQLACGDTKLAYSLAGTTLARVLETGAGFTFGMAHQILARTEIALDASRGTPTPRNRHRSRAASGERPSSAKETPDHRPASSFGTVQARTRERRRTRDTSLGIPFCTGTSRIVHPDPTSIILAARELSVK
jgi:hypothetical protein